MTSDGPVCQTRARSWGRVPLCDVGLQMGASGRSLEPGCRQVRRCAHPDDRDTPPVLRLAFPLSSARRYASYIVRSASNMTNISAICAVFRPFRLTRPYPVRQLKHRHLPHTHSVTLRSLRAVAADTVGTISGYGHPGLPVAAALFIMPATLSLTPRRTPCVHACDSP